jgi:hypothetical protein
MIMHPEISRLVAAQRIQEMQAQAAADRLAAQVRRDRPSSRRWVARLPRLSRLRIARPLPVRSPAPRKA